VRKVLFLAALSLAVAGCAHTPVAPPDERLRCADEPGVPPDPITDEKNGEYLGDLRAAGQDCRSAVGWLRNYFGS